MIKTTFAKCSLIISTDLQSIKFFLFKKIHFGHDLLREVKKVQVEHGYFTQCVRQRILEHLNSKGDKINLVRLNFTIPAGKDMELAGQLHLAIQPKSLPNKLQAKALNDAVKECVILIRGLVEEVRDGYAIPTANGFMDP